MSLDLQQYQESKHLHPLTLLYRFLGVLPQLLILIFFASRGDFESWIYLFLILLSFLLTVPFIVLNYYYFTFYINPKELVIRSGILAKKQRNIPIQRIQNINFEQNIVQRILGLTKIAVETAGDKQTEGMLECVSNNDAHEIKEIIKYYQSDLETKKEKSSINYEASEVAQESQTIPDEREAHIQTLFSMSIKDCIIYGMLRFRPLVLMFGFWIWTVMQQFSFLPFFRELDMESIFQNLYEFSFWEIVLFIFVALIVIIVLSWMMDIILTLNKFYGFNLSLEKNKLYTHYGLMTKRSVTIPLKKLQLLVISTNIIKKKFNFFTMDISTAGLGTNAKSSEVVVPFAKFEDLVTLAQKIKSFVFPTEFKYVSKKTIRRAFIRYMFFFMLPLLISLYFIFSIEWLLIILATPLLYYAAVLRWQYRGYHFTDDLIIVKQGYLFQRISIIPISKIQSLHVTANFFQRRLGLASLNIDTAAYLYMNDASIIDMDTNEADELMKEISQKFNKMNIVSPL